MRPTPAVFGLALIIALSSSACSSVERAAPQDSLPQLATSGTIIISGAIPKQSESGSVNERYAPLLGYAPSSIKHVPAEYTPAVNEYWLQISLEERRITLLRGEEEVRSSSLNGRVELEAGRYVLERLEQNPSWYAPDSYFLARGLDIPSLGSSLRFRRGALGGLALFGSEGLLLHSSPVWTEEVGGLQLEHSALNAMSELLSVGSPIEVR